MPGANEEELLDALRSLKTRVSLPARAALIAFHADARAALDDADADGDADDGAFARTP